VDVNGYEPNARLPLIGIFLGMLLGVSENKRKTVARYIHANQW